MKTESAHNGTLETWTPQEVAEAFDRDEIVLIDVRTPQEYSFERINGALLAPMQAFDPGHMPGQAEKRIVFHCGSGVRSKMVAEKCLAAGTERIAHMEGGFGAWKEAGFGYTGTDMATGAPKLMKKSG
ncbi:rhodanese-like domain-containing protein [Hoeflea sp. G2-23]|uniref:Rhodanese-like domain-containing protein n=1 Tax=Hoeflea algicola TaxID=2983763 RepID=A0ABT3Z6E4_9HYPH|nr:rhodanese-like domain-containing protein [Hoeflea algicola]MCY0147343.1 rhodanese-like domain-containing protein [Hoeflea algicola]